MTPYPPTATDDYLGLVQLPTGMTALSDWLDQSVKQAASPTFASITTTAGSVIDGMYVGRRTTEVSTNVFVGTDNSVITTGEYNTGIGEQAVHDVTSGIINTGCGYDSLGSVTTGDHNTACGGLALSAVVTGSNNAALGERAGSLLTGSMNTLGGAESMLPLVTGDSNTAFGYGAGEKQADGSTNLTTAYRSVYLGAACRGFDDTDDNTIVIGYAAKGEGPNTTAIGNADTTDCHLFGTPKFGDGTDETKTATLDLSGITTGTNRAFALPDASGTIVIGGGTCSGASSGTNTGDQTSVSGNAGTATALATPRTIGGGSFDGTDNVTSFPSPGAIGGTTPSTGRFTNVGIGVAPSAAASALLCVGGNPTTFTSSNYIGVVDSGSGGVVVVAKDSTNYGYLRFIGSGPYTDFSTVEGGTSYANSFVVKGGCLAIGSTTLPSGATRNLILGGGSTVLGAATADMVSQAGVDNGAGNREWQVQPEAGGLFALGNNKFRRVPTANQDVYHWTPTVNTTDGTQTTLATIPITASRTYMITARVVARRTGGSAGTADDGASYERRGTYTTKSGTVTLMGSVQTLGTDAEDQAGWDVTLDISTTNVRVRVTGATNNNVTWMGDITVQSVAS